MSQSRMIRDAVTVLTVATIYFVAGRFGLSLAYVNPSASPVWPPTGIALASLYLLGLHVWPGIWLGAFFVNLATTGTIATSVGIATGNTLEAVLGIWLTRRFVSRGELFDHPADVFTFCAIAGLLGTAVGASIGVTSLTLGGFAQWGEWGSVWLTWWLGDAAGALVLAPFLILWGRPPWMTWNWRQTLEAVALLCTLIVVNFMAFGGGGGATFPGYPLNFLCFPVLIWSAFRFTQRGAAAAVVLSSAIAIWATLKDLNSGAEAHVSEQLLILQAFMMVASVSSLALSASVSLRRRIEASLRLTTEALEQMVIDRAGRLWATRRELQTEVAERSRAAEELQKIEARLREAQEVARIGSWEWDIQQNLVWWSEGLYAIYGLDGESFRASYAGFLERVHPDDRERVHHIVGAALQDRQPFSFDHRIVHPDGQVLVVHGRGRVITDDSGRAVRMVGTAHDITERERAREHQASLAHEQAARRQAEEANQLKDEFLAKLSHELRNPLSAISVWADLLREGQLAGERKARAIDVIKRSAELQSQLILDLLDVSRIAAGRLELRRQPVDLATVVETALASVEPTALAKNISVAARLDGPGTCVLGDAERLQQVVWNLLSNAIRFAPEGGRVEVTVTARHSQACIRVEDNGPGIAPSLLPHVFEYSRRGDREHARRSDGLGLGLAIVRQLAQLHGGSVHATNGSRDGGAIFTVMLPLADVAAGPARSGAAPQPEPHQVSASGPGPAAQSLRGVRIMLVDDDLDSREPLALLLEAHGAEVVAANSCTGAMTLFESRPPDLLISDIGMPDEDGYELLSRVRALPDERGGNVPAIALTAYAGDEDAHKAIRCGYQVHMAKPFGSRDLVGTIGELLNRVPS